ncbi:pilus assembly protein [Escherichia coli]|nr:pilus assembly protein [Escherichia coli]OJQ29205.1 pilus assembly protein [Escherichia coli]OJQ39486.1 pilus assembly protein [Escherichia coli]
MSLNCGFKLNPHIQKKQKSYIVVFCWTGNDSNLLIVFYVQIMPDDFVMQLHRF